MSSMPFPWYTSYVLRLSWCNGFIYDFMALQIDWDLCTHVFVMRFNVYVLFFFRTSKGDDFFFIYLKCWYDSTLEINDALNRFSQPKQRLDEMKLCYSSIIFTNIKSSYFFLSNMVCRPLISNITSFACICNTRYSLSAWFAMQFLFIFIFLVLVMLI